MYGCSLLTADSELKLLLGYYVARLLDWMTFILDSSLHQLCNASLRNKALLLRLPVGYGGVLNSPRFWFFFPVSEVGLPLMGDTAVQYTDCYLRF